MRGRPLFRLGASAGSPSPSPSPDTSAGAGLGLGGRPLFRLGGASASGASSGLRCLRDTVRSGAQGRGKDARRTLGGLPRPLLGGASAGAAPSAVEEPAVAVVSAATVFLFLLPGGRPRLRLGGSAGVVAVEGGGGRIKQSQQVEPKALGGRFEQAEMEGGIDAAHLARARPPARARRAWTRRAGPLVVVRTWRVGLGGGRRWAGKEMGKGMDPRF